MSNMSNYGFEDGINGDFLPIVKINCQSGRVFRVDRHQDASGNWQSEEVDITDNFQFLPDFPSLEIGFIKIDDNGIDFQMQPFAMWDEQGRNRKPPAEGYRFGFRVPILLAKHCAGEPNDVRHLSHVGIGVREGVSKIYAEYQRRREEDSQDLLPVVNLAGFPRKQRGRFSNPEPQFEVTQWIERPDTFDEKLAVADAVDDVIMDGEGDDGLPF